MATDGLQALRDELSQVCKSLQTEVSGQVSLQSFLVLEGIIESCKMIADICESARASLDVKAMNGVVLAVEVSQNDSVNSVKRKIKEATGLPEWKQALVAGDKVVSSTQSISKIYQSISKNYPLPESLDLVIREPFDFLPNLRVFMACHASSDLQVDILTGQTWEAFDATQFTPTGVRLQSCCSYGRQGIQIPSGVILKSPAGIDVGDACTISMWTLFPFQPRSLDLYGYDEPRPPLLFEILGGPPPCTGAIVVGEASLAVGPQDHLRDNREPSPTDFDLMSLPTGWHHLCEVISGSDIHHYVDGELVGSTRIPVEFSRLELKLLGISMRITARQGVGLVTVSDVCVFGSAASAEQVEMLANSA